jgi:hypothetical protein
MAYDKEINEKSGDYRVNRDIRLERVRDCAEESGDCNPVEEATICT